MAPAAVANAERKTKLATKRLIMVRITFHLLIIFMMHCPPTQRHVR
jgi:hypothetical protein